MRRVFASFLFLRHNFIVGRFVVPRFLFIWSEWGYCWIFWEGLNCGCGRAGKEEAERERFTCFDDAESIQNFFGSWVLVRGLGF